MTRRRAKQADGPVTCAVEGCGKVWPRDPVLEVECPTCHQPPGSPCVVRHPSEHVLNAAFAGLPPWGHDERDLAAAAAGAYGVCPFGRCRNAPGWNGDGEETEGAEQLDLHDLLSAEGAP